MVIYRKNRGTLVDSMETAKEFNNFTEMVKYICDEQNELYGKNTCNIRDVVILEPEPDERIGWKDSMYVCLMRIGDNDCIKKYGAPQCIGMCATDYPRKQGTN